MSNDAADVYDGGLEPVKPGTDTHSEEDPFTSCHSWRSDATTEKTLGQVCRTCCNQRHLTSWFVNFTEHTNTHT